MMPEQMPKQDNVESDIRLKTFLNKIESNGFMISDYLKVANLSEKISHGDKAPIDQLNALISIKAELDSYDLSKLSKGFTDEFKVQFDKMINLIKHSLNDHEFAKVQDLINEIKVDAGIINSKEVSPEAISKRNQLYNQIQELNSNPNIPSDEKMVKFKTLLTEYNEAALKVNDSPQDREISSESINNIITKLSILLGRAHYSEIHDETYQMRKEAFDNVSNIFNEYLDKVNIIKHLNGQYEDLCENLGLNYNDSLQEELKTEVQSIEEDLPEITPEPTLEVTSVEIPKTVEPELEMDNSQPNIEIKFEEVDKITPEIIEPSYLSQSDDFEVEIEDVELNTESLDQTSDLEIEFDEMDMPKLDSEDIQTQSLNDDIKPKRRKVISHEIKNLSKGNLTIKILSISALIASTKYSPLAFGSAALWLYAEYKDRADYKQMLKLFPDLLNKINNNIHSINVPKEKSDAFSQQVRVIQEELQNFGLIEEEPEKQIGMRR